ncbi:MAG: hypothetical protein A2X13_03105 [Bacteroidetes bacterium GWC2_33_15]|nr:MAG: hypothetical protein A2X10_09640 [Bacteroidetes bacterium GWA2_33_15]OFX49587.1 MAG: hypothetical protein A2X13_03105 [Bacteroidetes bacterium GWC2_33_15]OFX63675.1 MAG: hypothetical protein A2X15_01120 [Bacteroidetes bacterium GWB2_32_14]OFX68889.1 MAG: hypothetical protein A2X14_13115 [Bacteroidetes bacterium GWD2_33_33]
MFGLDFLHTEEFVQLIARFGYNLFWVFIPSYFLYFRRKGDREYFFTYMIASIIVFQICILLGSVSLRFGFAIGLFAVFGILRYRTNSIPPRELTYLFLVIGISVKNAVANVNISFAELIITDFLTILIAYTIEVYFSKMRLQRKRIIYDRVDLIKPEKYQDLLKDLSDRFGLDVEKADIGPVDLIRDKAELIIYFKNVDGIGFFDSTK